MQIDKCNILLVVLLCALC